MGNSKKFISLNEIGHVAHIDGALQIIKDRKIKPGLIFHNSVLSDKRILVSWVSPNDWSRLGYRYGNIKFSFDFKKLIEGKRVYYVENIPYSVVAHRILITDIDRGDILEIYNPTNKDGPWWFNIDEELHYFDENYCLEFMFEGDIYLNSLSSFSFEKHHDSYCSVHRKSPSLCEEMGMPKHKAGALFLERAIARNIDFRDISRFFFSENKLSDRIDFFEYMFYKWFDDVEFNGDLDGACKISKAVARAVINAKSIGKIQEMNILASLFKCESAFKNAASILVSELIGFDDYALVLNKME